MFYLSGLHTERVSHVEHGVAAGESPLLAAIFEQVQESIIVVDLSGIVLTWSRGAERLLGWSAAERMGRSLFVGTSSCGDGSLRTLCDAIIAKGTVRLTAARMHRDGHEVLLDSTYSGLRDGVGQIIAIVDVSREAKADRGALAADVERVRLAALDRRVTEIEIVHRLDGTIVYVNDRAVEAYGYSREELYALMVSALWAPSSRALVSTEMACAAQPEGARFETEHQRRDGTSFPVEVSAHPFEVGGEPYIYSLVRDLTSQRRQQAERHAIEEREAAEQRQRDLVLDHAPFSMARLCGSVVLWTNRRHAELLRRPSEEIVGKNVRWLHAHEEDFDRLDVERKAAFAKGLPFSCEIELRRGDGTTVWCRATGQPTGDGENSIWSLEDLSAKRSLRAALAASEERLRTTFAAMAEGVVVQDATGKIVDCNAAAERILGLTREQIEGRSSMDPRWRSIHEDGSSFPGDEHPGMVTLRTGRSLSGVVMGLHRPDGERAWISVSSRPLGSETPPAAVVATFSDITELRRSHARLADREAQLARVIGASQEAYFEWNVDTGFVYRSPRAACLIGVEPEAVPPTVDGWLQFVHPGDLKSLRESLAGLVADGDSFEIEYRVRHSDGTWRWLHTRAARALSPDGTTTIAGMFSEVTERREAAERMREALARNESLVEELRGSLEQVKTLSGLLPICMYCKNIRNDAGYWEQVEKYLATRSGATFSHGICPGCCDKVCGDLDSEDVG